AERVHSRRAKIPIIDRKFQFKVTLLVVGVITLTHLGVGAFMYQSIAEFSAKLVDFVPDLEADVEYFRRWMLKYMLLTIATTFVAIVLLSLYFSSRISGPLYNMSRVIRRVTGGEFARRISLRRDDELKEFSEVANDLFASLDSRFAKVRTVLESLRAAGG